MAGGTSANTSTIIVCFIAYELRALSADSPSEQKPRGHWNPYRAWSEGGMGLLITGNSKVDRRYIGHPRIIVVDGALVAEDFVSLELINETTLHFDLCSTLTWTVWKQTIMLSSESDVSTIHSANLIGWSVSQYPIIPCVHRFATMRWIQQGFTPILSPYLPFHMF